MWGALLTRPVRANQKDSYFSSSFQSQITDVLHIFKGQKFVNTHPEEIAVAAKSLYFALTTLIGARTLGEEYVDIMYVSRLGKRFPKFLQKLGFLLSYVLVPYVITRIMRKLKSKEEDKKKGWLLELLTSYPKLLDTFMNLHVAVFYFQGLFYLISKRLFGMRYVFGHGKDPKKLQQTGNYSVLGGIILVQFAMKFLLKVKEYSDSQHKSDLEKQELHEQHSSHETYYKLEQLEKLKVRFDEESINVDLSDPAQLPYIPETSRNCMLCLSPMVDPSAANCGHMFCWECIVDWVREHPECPLCRQVCLEQNLLPLK